MDVQTFLQEHQDEIINGQWGATDFYKTKNNKLFPIPKQILYKYIDEFKPRTFLWVLKELDIPFIEDRWRDLLDKELNKVPSPKIKNFYINNEISPVLGRYISLMQLQSYKYCTFEDSLELNFDNQNYIRSRSFW